MRPIRRDEKPLQIQITGRNVLSDTSGDRELLAKAKAIVTNQAAAEGIPLDNLRVIYDTCQRYALGKAQRALTLAIDSSTLPGH